MARHRVKPGDVLGAKYKVERVLGVGGMGVVVAATHVDLGQRVAVKFMLEEASSDPAHAERFLREAKAAVQLKSAHTARVLDVGRLKNGEPFMVMEYLEGRDLDAELQARGPLPPHVAVNYILQTIEAIAEAHSLGIVHRDLKLKNLFLTQTIDGLPQIKVLDFGLAKTATSNGDVSLTAVNSVFGSPQYMSPEQMRSAKDVDGRSDVWSIGVCLYELLTGRVPFDAQGVAEICAMVLKDEVPPPSQLVPMPADLEQAILRCLEKDPNRRFSSVAELAFALETYGPDEGSARRILHVMRSASKVDHPTTFAAPSSDPNGKTLSPWHAGTPAARSRLTRSQMATGMAVVTLLLTVGLLAIFLVVKRNSVPRGDFPPSAAVGAPEVAPFTAVPIVSTSPAPTPAEPPRPVPSAAPTVLAGASDPPEPAAIAPKPSRRVGPPHMPPARAPASVTPTAKPAPKKQGPGSGADYM